MHLSSSSFRRLTRGVAGIVACVLAGTGTSLLQAADRPVTGIVEREIARRNRLMQEARALITEGGLLYSKGDYALSASAYRQAWDLLPDSPMSAQMRIEARDGYSRSAVAHAGKLAAGAHYAESRALLKTVLADDFDPDNIDAKVLEKRLDDPDRYEPALTPQHLDNVAKVEKELRLASGYMTLGDYNRAIPHYHEVLLIDPYNQAARRGMERVEQLKSVYYDTARDHYRAKAMAEVDRGWEDQVPVLDVSALFGAPTAQVGLLGRKESVLTKLRSFTIPIVEMQGASLAEVVEFLRIRTRDMDPLKKGVDFVLKVSPEIASRPLSLSMVGAPVEEVLRYATELTGTVYRVDEFAITITSQAEKSTAVITKSYRVPPDFLQNAPAAATPTTPDPFAPQGGGAAAGGGFAGLQIRRLGPREFLEQRGVSFPAGSSASYTPSTNILIVTNTAENLAMVDNLVEQATSATPKQVEIQVRMLEVNDIRLRELGFDWLMGQFNVPGSSRIFASGGTVGNQSNSTGGAEDFPFVPPSGGAGAVPPVGVNPITAGLRSTGAIFGAPSIDQLIGRVAPVAIDSKSPGTFAVSGVFTDPQFQMVMRALSQDKGVDILASPSVVTKSGQRANVALVREFIYPTEFDPPQIPQTVGDPRANNNPLGVPPIVPVTPSTPTAFEKRDVGISLEVEPVIGAGNRQVDLNLVPSTVEFEGFIDYGEPIKFTGSLAPTEGFATLNRILQPVFRTNKISTNVTVWDGQTVVLGGVMMEKRQDLKDKVPIVGDLPIIGRTFQSRVTFTEKKNVLFFVTVRVVDPGGNRINQPVIEDPAAALR